MLTSGSATLERGSADILRPARRTEASPRAGLRHSAATLPIITPPPRADAWERSTYRPSTRQRTLSAAAALLVVAGSMASLILLHGAAPTPRSTPHPQVVSMPLTPPPSRQPPPPAHRAKLDPPRAQIAAPTPAIVLPHDAPAVATAPEPAPPTPITMPAAPTPAQIAATAPATAPAPPAIADGGNLSARMVSAKPPTYPIESRHLREMGTVTLAVLVATNGSVAEISVAQSSGSARLDQAALGAVRKWRWAPLVRDGQPVMVRGRVRIPFVLKG